MRFAPLFFTLFVYLIFDGFLVQIWACNFDVLAAFGHLFGTLFSQMQRECFLIDFGVDFGSLLAPICPPLAPFWQPLAPFWISLDPFGRRFGTSGEHFGHPTSLVQRATPHVQRAMPHSQPLALSDSTLVNIFCILAPSNNK